MAVVLSITNYLLAKGATVITVVHKLKWKKESQTNCAADGLFVIKVDVQNQEDVDATFKRAEATFGGIVVGYNNAGYSTVSEVEAMSLSEGKDMCASTIRYWYVYIILF